MQTGQERCIFLSCPRWRLGLTPREQSRAVPRAPSCTGRRGWCGPPRAPLALAAEGAGVPLQTGTLRGCGAGWPCPHGVLLLLILATTFFSFTRLFWNQMVICLSVRLVAAEIFLLLSRVMNLLLAYSFSSSFSCPLL